MLKEQEQDLINPKNPIIIKYKKLIEDHFFSEQAKKAKKQEIEEIIEQIKERMNKAMVIKSDWDMNVDLKRL